MDNGNHVCRLHDETARKIDASIDGMAKKVSFSVFIGIMAVFATVLIAMSGFQLAIAARVFDKVDNVVESMNEVKVSVMSIKKDIEIITVKQDRLERVNDAEHQKFEDCINRFEDGSVR